MEARVYSILPNYFSVQTWNLLFNSAIFVNLSVGCIMNMNIIECDHLTIDLQSF